tara:strand:- start:33604 stop:34887 length:1284 start_codon:yes stop_codon:yes gene_type:complete
VKSSEISSIEAWVPRGLIGNPENILSIPVTEEGLCPIRICWVDQRVISLEKIEDSSNLPLKLLLPRLVEPHAHIDKAFTWEEFPNLSGNYDSALKRNLEELKVRSIENLIQRSEKSLNLAFKNGLRSIRTHIDSFGFSGHQYWEALIDLKIKWEKLIDLQCVALVPLEYWSSEEGCLLADRVANWGGLLGGVLVPPCRGKKTFKSLLELIKLANELGCGIDIHIDESSREPGSGLKQLIRVLDSFENKVPITCSHLSSMGLLSPNRLKYMADRLASHQVNVVALPFTNAWLLGRKQNETPVKRPLAPIRQLQEAGVTVAIGGDNVQDPWFPYGDFDPITLISGALPLTQLAPWERLGLAPFTTSAAALMGLNWDGTIKINGPANFVILKATTWAEALSSKPCRELIVDGTRFDEETLSNSPKADAFN